jgi:hypothetical protein
MSQYFKEIKRLVVTTALFFYVLFSVFFNFLSFGLLISEPVLLD